MPTRNSSAVQMLAWNITWLTPWADGPDEADAVQRPSRLDPGRAQGQPEEEERPGRDDERRGVGRERHVPPRQPGHQRRHDAADDQQDDARRARPEEEERGDPDQGGVEAVDPGERPPTRRT